MRDEALHDALKKAWGEAAVGLVLAAGGHLRGRASAAVAAAGGDGESVGVCCKGAKSCMGSVRGTKPWCTTPSRKPGLRTR